MRKNIILIDKLKIFELLLLCLFLSSIIAAQTSDELQSPKELIISSEVSKINDGPYVFIESKELVNKSIVDGIVSITQIDPFSYSTKYKPNTAIFFDVDEIAVFSDIHGQFDLAIEILKNNQIINENLQWDFGTGHLVILGDIFDRGDKVTEFLWFVYHLEAQAKQSGGKVHYLLGNHEYMVLRNDLRYIHEKYALTSELLNSSYGELFGYQTILGRWLRSKPTIIKINDKTFVHGGISKELLSINTDIGNINKLMRESIDVQKEEMSDTSFYKSYYKSKGPIWYRGYFEDNMTDEEIDEILNELETNHIIVGHSSNEQVVQLFDGKIYGVDSSIKNGEYGEILLIRNGNYYRGTLEGNQILFD